MTDYWFGALFGFCVGAGFVGTLVFLTVRQR